MSKKCNPSPSCIYGLGLIGALFYNWQYAQGFGQVMWGLFKSLTWPAYLVYNLLAFLQV